MTRVSAQLGEHAPQLLLLDRKVKLLRTAGAEASAVEVVTGKVSAAEIASTKVATQPTGQSAETTTRIIVITI